MASCPNCGRRTLRTKDWVCQWCGYPLLSGSFKPIDKTYKELQQERNSTWKSVKPEPEPAFDFEAKPQVQPVYQPEQELEPEPEPEPELETGAETATESELKIEEEPSPIITPSPEPVAQLEEEIPVEAKPEEPSPIITPPPEPVAQLEEEIPVETKAEEPAPMITPPPEPVVSPEGEKALEPEVVPEAEPQPIITPPPEPVAPPKEEIPAESLALPSLDSIKDGTELTTDQIDALFTANSLSTSDAFRDKTLVIRGMVSKVFIRDHLDVRYMMLSGANKGAWTVRCQFGKESSPQMSRLSEGQPVAVRGKYDGFSKNVIFKDCVLVG